ncbi:conserved hypothetical protein [Ricinus communis]|uniref:Plasmid encoded RepA protein n=1 Tax=Ricinus communis TaxID=3988 RepID=B9TQS5_RICCO|nr:conserved hypothetical protein [Ricinus communis]
MKRLFGSLVTAQYTGSSEGKGFTVRNVLIADEFELDEEEAVGLWVPQRKSEAGAWRSKVRLSNNFYKECIDRPVPVDLRAYKALRGSPLAMDVYIWLTYRMSCTERRTRPIRWEALMAQFGSRYESDQAARDFKKGFLKALKLVQLVYPSARVLLVDNGLVLLPSPPHVQRSAQIGLFT